jgi:carbon storage regulator
MLVLSRKVGQKILIGDNISVTVVRVGQGGVRIGVEAPEEMEVVREELKATDPGSGGRKSSPTSRLRAPK